jgi:hypothetical protein
MKIHLDAIESKPYLRLFSDRRRKSACASGFVLTSGKLVRKNLAQSSGLLYTLVPRIKPTKGAFVETTNKP